MPDLIKRVDLGPSAYPYGPELLNEFRWHGWDPNDQGQKADAEKIHSAYDDWANMIAFAWREADQITDTFKRWFDESNAQDVKNVLERMVSQSGVQQPTELMKDWICEKDDIKGQCTPGRNAYSVANRGIFHFCPQGLQKPNARDMTCDVLDGFASEKMKSIAFTLLHESTHWTQVGDAALGGRHIKDFANGASDCFGLSPENKLLNAQNYAFLGAEAYFKVKGCTFTDPPPGTRDADEVEGDTFVTPDTFTGGWCGMHVTQYQKNEPDVPAFAANNPEYVLEVCIYDANQVLLNKFDGEDGCGNFVALNGQSQAIVTALPNLMYITVGAVDDDAVLFTYGNQDWGSNDQEHHSDFGPYDSGKREGDTGFSC